MTPEQKARFLQDGQRITGLMTENFVESNRVRDIEVIGRLRGLMIAASDPEWRIPADKNSEDFLLAGVIIALREEIPEPLSAVQDPTDACDIESALAREILRIGEAAIGLRTEIVLAEMARIQAKYGVEIIDPSKLDAADRQAFDDVIEPVRKGLQERQQLIDDLARLYILEGTSERLLKSLRADLRESPGDTKALGRTWKLEFEAGQIPKEQVSARGFITLFDSRIPSEAAKLGQEIDKRLGSAQ